MVVPHTFGGDLKFNAHLHILISADGLSEAEGRLIPVPQINKVALMRMWRYAVITHLRLAVKAQVLRSDLSMEGFHKASALAKNYPGQLVRSDPPSLVKRIDRAGEAVMISHPCLICGRNPAVSAVNGSVPIRA